MSLDSEPSVVPAIVLSDLTIVEQGTGKRSIIGAFDELKFPQFPARVGRFFVNAWVSNIEGTLTEVDLTTLIKARTSGHVVFSSSGKIAFGKEQKFERVVVLAVSTAVIGATFPNPNIYSVVLLLNGEEAGSRDFNVIQVSKPQPKEGTE